MANYQQNQSQRELSRHNEEQGRLSEINSLRINSAPTVSREEALGKNISPSSNKNTQAQKKSSGGVLDWIEDKAHELGEAVGKGLGNALGSLKKIVDFAVETNPVFAIAKWLEKGGAKQIWNGLKTAIEIAGKIVSSKEFWIGLALGAISIAVPAVGLALMAMSVIQAGVAIANHDYATAAVCLLSILPGLRGVKGVVSGLKSGITAGLKEAAPLVAEKAYAAAAKTLVKNVALSGGALSPATKEAAKAFAKPLEESAEKFLTKNLSNESLATAVDAIGHESGKKAANILVEHADEIAGKALDSKEVEAVLKGVKDVASKEANEKIYELLEKSGLKGHLDKEVEQLLKLSNNRSGKFAKLLQEVGYSKEEAKELAKEFKTALRVGGDLPGADKALQQEISDKLSEKIISHLKARKITLKNGEIGTIEDAFRNSFDEEIDALVKANPGKFSDELIGAVKKSGLEGFNEGMSIAVNRIVSEAVASAFRRFREGSSDIQFGAAQSPQTDQYQDGPFLMSFAPLLAYYSPVNVAQEINNSGGGSFVYRKQTDEEIASNMKLDADEASKKASIYIRHTRLDGVNVEGEDLTGGVFGEDQKQIADPLSSNSSMVSNPTHRLEVVTGSMATNIEHAKSKPELRLELSSTSNQSNVIMPHKKQNAA